MVTTPNKANVHVSYGPGGRSSVSGQVATVFGCTGFVGRYLVNKLGKMGTQVVVPYRGNLEDVRHLKIMGDLGQIVPLRFDMRYDAQIADCMAHSNIAYNLIGRNWDTKNFTIEQVHIESAQKLAKIARQAGVENFVHFSAIGASKDSKSRLLRAKALGEEAVLAEFPDATIIRPASIFGFEDRFYTRIGRFMRLCLGWQPVVNAGESIVRPVYVGDVASVAADIMKDSTARGKVVELYSPRSYFYKTMVEIFNDYSKRDMPIVRIPESLAVKFANAHNKLCYSSPVIAPEEVVRATLDEQPTLGGKSLGRSILTFDHFNIRPQFIENHAIKFTRVFRPSHLAGESIEEVLKVKRFISES